MKTNVFGYTSIHDSWSYLLMELVEQASDRKPCVEKLKKPAKDA